MQLSCARATESTAGPHGGEARTYEAAPTDRKCYARGMRRRSYQFVVTVSAFAACTPSGAKHNSVEPSPSVTSDGPAPKHQPLVATTESADAAPATSDAASATTTDPPRLADYPNLLNPKDAAGRVIHRAWHGSGCYVELPFAALKPGEQRPPGTAPPTNPVACPPAMTDPAYTQCRGGTISQNGAGDACICFIMGNPPPLPKAVPCPSK